MTVSAITDTIMVETLNAAQAAQLIAAHSVDVVDVRDDVEWHTGHIPGARLVPLDRLRAEPEQLGPTSAAIVFVCAKGVRSLTAAKLAERLGYAKVYNLDGGTKAWERAGFELVIEPTAVAA